MKKILFPPAQYAGSTLDRVTQRMELEALRRWDVEVWDVKSVLHKYRTKGEPHISDVGVLSLLVEAEAGKEAVVSFAHGQWSSCYSVEVTPP